MTNINHHKNGQWLLLDSLNAETNYKALRSAMSILYKLPGRIELNTVRMQQQEGASDCDLFAIACAIELCIGNNPATLQFQQNEMRTHYQQYMDNQLLSSFPQTSRDEQLVYQARRLNRKWISCKLHVLLLFS